MKPIMVRGSFRADSILALGCVMAVGVFVSGCNQPQERASAEVRQGSPGLIQQPTVPEYKDEVVLFGALPSEQNKAREPFPPTPLIQHTWLNAGADFDPNLDSTGERLVFASTRHAPNPDLYVKAVDGAAVTQLTSDPASDINPVFSPDGSKVAFASNRSGNWDIWVLKLNEQTVSQVTRSQANELYPTWAPDGQRLAYCSLNEKSGDWELWVISLAKEGPAKFIGHGMYPRWSPVNDTIVFQRARRRGRPLFSIWMMELKNGEPDYATEIAASDTSGAILPSWSPEGTHVAYCTVEVGGGVTDDQGRPRSEDSIVWVVDRDGRNRIRLTDALGPSYSPAWSPDGRIYFSSSRNSHENIWSVLPRLEETPARVTRAE